MSDITRTILQDMEKRLGENKVLLLYGTRRVGKTKLLNAIIEKQKKKPLLLNGEDLDVQQLLA